MEEKKEWRGERPEDTWHATKVFLPPYKVLHWPVHGILPFYFNPNLSGVTMGKKGGEKHTYPVQRVRGAQESNLGPLVCQQESVATHHSFSFDKEAFLVGVVRLGK